MTYWRTLSIKKETTSGPKLVLSRKGFDSGSGGHYSPIESKSGKYIWFPIPDKKEAVYTNAIRYEDIQIQPDYLTGYSDRNLYDLYHSRFGEDEITLSKCRGLYPSISHVYAHYDPMLGAGPWLSPEQTRTIGRGFGQSNALGHLLNQKVHTNSVFLFFGAFGCLETGLCGHYIFGLMKVGPVIDTFAEVGAHLEKYGLEHHPHIQERAFGLTKKKRPKNRIYLPDEFLYHDDELRVPGCGYFKTLNDGLRLTQDPSPRGSYLASITERFRGVWYTIHGDSSITDDAP